MNKQQYQAAWSAYRKTFHLNTISIDHHRKGRKQSGFNASHLSASAWRRFWACCDYNRKVQLHIIETYKAMEEAAQS